MTSSSSVLCEDQLQCCICLDVFTDPVSTPCGHNFCMICLKEFWDSSSYCQCPVCKEEFPIRPKLRVNTFISGLAADCKKSIQEKSSSAENPTQSLVLCDVCCEKKCAAVKSCLICMISYCKTHLEPHETVSLIKKHKLMDPVENLEDYICQKHERPLELFCRDDQMSVCRFCTEGDHKSHNTVPIEERESGEKKTELGKTRAEEVRQMIQKRLKKIEEIKHHVKLNKVNTEMEKLNVVEIFSELVRCIERSPDEVQRQAGKALSQLRETLRKEKDKIPDIKLKRIQRYAVDVTLDPDTANPTLILSDDRKQVTCGITRQNLPDNPERFNWYPCVLGKQGFSSGRFYYEVQVRGKTKWNLGVVRESINRKGMIMPSPVGGYWCLYLWNKTEYEALHFPSVSLSLKQAPQKVGVFVDYEEGLVSFYDVDVKSHIYSFTDQTFTEKLYPYFNPCFNEGGKNSAPLIICTVNQI